MPLETEVHNMRWSRGCGSGGLGPSGGVAGDGYRAGVLEGNYVEDMAGEALSATGRGVYNYGHATRDKSFVQESYTPYGKTGEQLAYVAQRQDRELNNLGQKADTLFRHGSYLAEPMDASASLNSLTYGEKQVGEPNVQTYLWNGSNLHNRTVPLKTATLDLTRKKVDKWANEMDPDSTFKTTSRTATLAAALPAATSPSKTQTLKPMTDGGQLSQVGRKPCGPNQQECDKNYRVIGLRDTYCTFLTAPKR